MTNQTVSPEPPVGHRDASEPMDPRSPIDQRVIDYYSTAGLDYEPWSADYNMHFGYYRWPLNPLRREALLVQMNREVYARLGLVNDAPQQLIDLGCGVGAAARFGVAAYSNASVSAITIVPWQIDKAQELTSESLINTRIAYRLADYRHTPFADASFDAAYAIESSCYDWGLGKAAFLTEAARILKPGGTLVVADGFRIRSNASRFFEYCFSGTCEGWSLDTFAQTDAFADAAVDAGFDPPKFENVSLAVTPSVLHVPWVSLKFWWQEVGRHRGNQPLAAIRKNHLKAPLLGMLTGAHFWNYGYFLVTLRRSMGNCSGVDPNR